MAVLGIIGVQIGEQHGVIPAAQFARFDGVPQQGPAAVSAHEMEFRTMEFPADQTGLQIRHIFRQKGDMPPDPLRAGRGKYRGMQRGVFGHQGRLHRIDQQEI